MSSFKALSRIAAIGLAAAVGLLAMAQKPAVAQSGTWALSGASASGPWATTSNWLGDNVAAGSGNTATFGSQGDISASATITLADPTEIGNITFTRTATSAFTWTIQDSGGDGPLTLAVGAGTPTITTNNTGAGITTSVSGTQGLIKTGSGTLVFGGAANDYTGVTTVNAGTLRVENSDSLGASGSANKTVVANTARVQFAGGITVPEDFEIAGAGSSGALNNGQNTNTLTGKVTMTAAATIGSGAGSVLTFDRSGAGDAIDNGGNLASFTGSGNIEVKSPIVGSGGLSKAGNGTTTFTAANTYTGTTGVTGGVLNVRNSSALGTGAASVTVTAQLQLQGGITISKPLTISGVATANSGALRNISGNNTYAGAVTLSALSQINSDADTLTLSGGVGGAFRLQIGGAGNTVVSGNITTGANILEKRNAGTLTMTGVNTYSGTTLINGGSLQLGNGGAAGSLNTSSVIDIASGASFIVNQSDAVVQGTDFSTAAIIGQGGFTQAGSGTTTLNAANEYKGTTAVNAGTLRINGDHRNNATGAVTVAAGATLGGSGFVGGAVTVNGILSPGNSPGVLTVPSVVLNASSTSLFEINTTTRGTGYDGLDVSDAGGVTYGGALSLNFGNGSAFANNTTFDLFNFTGSPTGNFSSVSSTGFYAGTWTLASDTWSLTTSEQKLSFTPSTGDLVIAVPEPSTLVLLAGFAVGGRFLVRRRPRA